MNSNTSDKPWALLLAHAVPDPLGSDERLRAWQLLKLLSQTHRVALACMEDGPVSLPQWRDLQRHAQRVHIEPGRELRRRVRASLQAVAAPLLGSRASLAHPLAGVEALPCREAHAVLATHPALLSDESAIHRLTRVVGPRVVDLCRAAPLSRPNADAAITPTADAPVGSWRGPITVLPPALDRESLRGQTGRSRFDIHGEHDQPDHPTLVLHGEWSRPETRRDHQRLLARVWPGVRQQVPNARLYATAPTADTDRYQQLARADVLCCLPLEPTDAHWPAAQGLALHLPTLVAHHPHATPRPGTRATGNTTQLIHAIAELLTSAPQRHALSTAAAFHDEGEPDTAQQAARMAAVLQPGRLEPRTLPIAPPLPQHARAA